MKNIFQITILFILISSCSGNDKQQFEHSGGTLRMAIDNPPTTFIPRNVQDYYSATVLNQIGEGLVGIDSKTLETIPKIAFKWTQSEDGKTYSFTIRKDVYFHEHSVFESKKERLLTMEDVVHSFERACSKNDDNSSAVLQFSF